MYDVSSKYNTNGYSKVFAIVVDAKNYNEAKVTVDYENAAPVLTTVNNNDLNGSGAFNLRDITVVFGVYNGSEDTFENYMNIVLNADVNNDGVVNGTDTDAFVQAYNAN